MAIASWIATRFRLKAPWWLDDAIRAERIKETGERIAAVRASMDAERAARRKESR